jgi:predicted DNA-binding transcriptional regulator AlpA
MPSDQAATSSSSTPVKSPQDDIILTVAEVAELLRCKPSSVYNLTRRTGRARYDNPIPVMRLPMGLRFKKSSIVAWLASQETAG